MRIERNENSTIARVFLVSESARFDPLFCSLLPHMKKMQKSVLI